MCSGAPKPGCLCCPCQGDWLEPPSPPTSQGFVLHVVRGSCVTQLGFQKPRPALLLFPCNSGRKPKLMSEAVLRASGKVQTRSTPGDHCSSMHLHCAESEPRPGHCDLHRADASLRHAGGGSWCQGGCFGASSVRGCGSLPPFSLPCTSVSLQALLRSIFPTPDRTSPELCSSLSHPSERN